MKNIELNAIYHHEKTGRFYKPLFVNLLNDDSIIVYIDGKNHIWAKKKERFTKGMVKTQIETSTFIYQVNDPKERLLKEGIKNVEVVCLANEYANDSIDYPLMVVVNKENNFYIYTLEELKRGLET